jgi:hypothetical protein
VPEVLSLAFLAVYSAWCLVALSTGAATRPGGHGSRPKTGPERRSNTCLGATAWVTLLVSVAFSGVLWALFFVLWAAGSWPQWGILSLFLVRPLLAAASGDFGAAARYLVFSPFYLLTLPFARGCVYGYSVARLFDTSPGSRSSAALAARPVERGRLHWQAAGCVVGAIAANLALPAAALGLKVVVSTPNQYFRVLSVSLLVALGLPVVLQLALTAVARACGDGGRRRRDGYLQLPGDV